MSKKRQTKHSPTEAVLQSWAADPCLFAWEVFEIDAWDKQAELLRAVAAHDSVAVRAGQKVSKSNSAGILAYWFALTRMPSRVVMTSSSAYQVKDILWREVHALWLRAKERRGLVLSPQPPALDPATGLQLATGDIKGVSTNTPERAAGTSGAHLFFIIDEASGIEEAILDAYEGNRAGGAKMLMLSQGTRTSGKFFKAFHQDREFWHRLHISSEDSPNVRAGRQIVPGLALKDYVEKRKKEWGENSVLYRVRIKGEFASQGSKAVVAFDSLEAALKRHKEGEAVEDGFLELGVDPAREGDDSFVIYPRRGGRGFDAFVHQGLDGPNGAGKVLEAVRALREARDPKKIRVKIDVIGIGASVYDCLKESDEVEAIAVSVAESPTVTAPGEPKYGTLRDQLWFGVKEWLKTAALPADSMLEAELIAPEYGFNTKGCIKVEDKATTKKKLGRSPDRADALALAVYNPPPPAAPATYRPRSKDLARPRI
jgi:phage terminase large subunit